MAAIISINTASENNASNANATTDVAEKIIVLGKALGFSAVGIADIALEREAEGFNAWLAAGHHGEMEYMARHGEKRWRPDELEPGTHSVICVALDYWPEETPPAPLAGVAEVTRVGTLAASNEPHRTSLLSHKRRGEQRSALATLADPNAAYISRYALGRDYHKVIRNKLQTFAEAINAQIEKHTYRVFTDSAPVMETPLAVKAGLGWRGKHTLLLNRERGSYFFLGEIYTSLKLPTNTEPQSNHCGTCSACSDICPTQAITAPHRLDARRCISYLTIELKTAIPIEFRKAIGNRIYGCDDCQIVCPWNKFANKTEVPDFAVRNDLDSATLIELFAWNETEFDERLQGSAIRRIGHERWLRNIAVALGNAPSSAGVTDALCARADHVSALVREHVAWALQQHGAVLSN
jgi:epoxyqueuosine reductase